MTRTCNNDILSEKQCVARKRNQFGTAAGLAAVTGIFFLVRITQASQIEGFLKYEKNGELKLVFPKI